MFRGLIVIFLFLEILFFKVGNVCKRGGRVDLLIGGREFFIELLRF